MSSVVFNTRVGVLHWSLQWSCVLLLVFLPQGSWKVSFLACGVGGGTQPIHTVNRLVVDRQVREEVAKWVKAVKSQKSLFPTYLKHNCGYAHSCDFLQTSGCWGSLSLILFQPQTIASSEDTRFCFSVGKCCCIIPRCWFIRVDLRVVGDNTRGDATIWNQKFHCSPKLEL